MIRCTPAVNGFDSIGNGAATTRGTVDLSSSSKSGGLAAANVNPATYTSMPMFFCDTFVGTLTPAASW